MSKIEKFDGEHRFLSNFWPCSVIMDGDVYTSVEHAYQAAKFARTTMSGVKNKHGHEYTMRGLIAAQPSAGAAKKYGRWHGIRSDWDQVKLRVMEDLVRQKFENKELAKKLRATGAAELIEGNWWGDTYWGICNGRGQNKLGIILMGIRNEITSTC